MRATLAVLSLAAGIGLFTCQSAVAFPVPGDAMAQSAAAASGVERTQYNEHYRRRGYTKCYREFVVGRYVCRTYHHW
jgi:hypothetical protein